ncbi:unnamed protein product, partial [marine sediment metagenome]
KVLGLNRAAAGISKKHRLLDLEKTIIINSY